MNLKSQKIYPKVSVILPFYNRTKVTLSAISSVEAQTFQNIELIVINDGSSELDTHLVESKVSTIPNAIYINNPVNSGPAFARNLGIKRASGTYLSFLDSDDTWLPNKLTTQISLMQKNNWLFSHTSYLQIHQGIGNEKIIHSGKKSYTFPFVAFSCRIATPTVVLKRSLLSINKFNAKFKVGEDHLLWTRLARLTTLHGVDQVLSKVNINDSSTFKIKENLKISQKNLRNQIFKSKKILFFLHFLYNLLKFIFFDIKTLIFSYKAKKPEIIIYANNIHNGGGLTILFFIIKAINSRHSMIYLDSRIKSHPFFVKNINLNIKYVRPFLIDRFLAEISLFLNSSKETSVFSLGNLPPIFKLRSSVFLLIHNKLLITSLKFTFLDFNNFLRLFYEKFWIRLFSKNVDFFIVQTNLMEKTLRDYLQKNQKPIFSFQIFNHFYLSKVKDNEVKYDFTYVASADKHKNHKTLIEAWILLANEGLFPSLCLTLNKDFYTSLISNLSGIKGNRGLRLFNAGEIELANINNLYSKSSALIYPSLSESFGLPLLEAKYLGMPIIASELDYVRELVNPVESFDPNSANSIARAVKRYLGIKSKSLKKRATKDLIDFILSQKPI
jgi:glycosyltransferase involved in cell wall biosynthesis